MSLDRTQPATPGSPHYIENTGIRSSPGLPTAARNYANPGTNAAALDSPITRLELLSTHLSTPFITSISGAISGIASGIVTCPLDVIKTKLQAQGGFRSARPQGAIAPVATYRGLVGTARSIWLEEGARGMYRGLFPMVLGYFPTWAVYFTVYDRAKEFWYQQLNQGGSLVRMISIWRVFPC